MSSIQSNQMALVPYISPEEFIRREAEKSRKQEVFVEQSGQQAKFTLPQKIILKSLIQEVVSTNNFSTLLQHLQEPFSDKSSISVLASDFDHCIGVSECLIGSDHFHEWMMTENLKRKVKKTAHEPLLQIVRERSAFRCCEEAAIINGIFNRFRAQGKVVILTARPASLLHVTEKNISEMGLSSFSRKDILFSNGKEKSETLANYLQSLPNWNELKKVKVIFIDDKKKYCSDLLNNLAARIPSKKVNVFSYLYTKHTIEANLSQKQFEIATLQYAALVKRSGIPVDTQEYSSGALREACQVLGISEPVSIKNELYNAIEKIAEKSGVPFKNSVDFSISPTKKRRAISLNQKIILGTMVATAIAIIVRRLSKR